jgi:hypothetical protein
MPAAAATEGMLAVYEKFATFAGLASLTGKTLLWREGREANVREMGKNARADPCSWRGSC